MSYYGQKGDFYTGRTGYYRRYGDPGFLGNLLGDVKNIFQRNVVPAVAGFMSSGPVGAVTGALGTAARAVASHPAISAAAAAGTATAVGAVMSGGRKTVSPGVMTLPGVGRTLTVGGRRLAVGGRRRRRMHVTNVKALRRAIRRARGFEKIARKVMGFTSPHRPKGRVYFKHKRRRS